MLLYHAHVLEIYCRFWAGQAYELLEKSPDQLKDTRERLHNYWKVFFGEPLNTDLWKDVGEKVNEPGLNWYDKYDLGENSSFLSQVMQAFTMAGLYHFDGIPMPGHKNPVHEKDKTSLDAVWWNVC